MYFNFWRALLMVLFNIVFITCTYSVDDFSYCSTLLAHNKTHKYIHISLDKYKSHSERVKISEIFPDSIENDLFIGFSRGHSYLVYNGIRYDGGWLYKPGKFTKSNLLDEGLVIRLTNLPYENIVELDTIFKERKMRFDLVCSYGSCHKIKKSKVLSNKKTNSLTPSIMFNSLLKDGVIENSDFEILFIGKDEDTPRAFLRRSRLSEFLIPTGIPLGALIWSFIPF